MRLIDADALLMNMNLTIAILEGTMKNLGLQDDAECQMELKAYRNIRDGIKDEPTIEPSAQPATNCSEIPNSSDDTISRQAAIDAVNEYLRLSEVSKTVQNMTSIQAILRWLPSAQPEIIRCKDCKYSSPNGKYGCKSYHYKLYETHEMKPDDFCSFAERRTDE